MGNPYNTKGLEKRMGNRLTWLWYCGPERNETTVLSQMLTLKAYNSTKNLFHYKEESHPRKETL